MRRAINKGIVRATKGRLILLFTHLLMES